MDGTVLFGFLKVIGISLVPVAFMSVLIHGRAIHDRYLAVGRRLHVLAPARIPPAGPPLEKLAADLRRLRPQARAPRPGVAMAKQRGIVAAYEEVLLRTARALGVSTTLAELPSGIDHEAERLRLEHALTEAGLSWQVQEH